MPDFTSPTPTLLNAAQQSAQSGVQGFGTVAIQIQGTYTGTITFEGAVGTEFEPFRVTKSDNSTPVTTTTTTGLYSGSVAGYSSVRARMSAYTNGGAFVTIGAAVAGGGGAGGGGGSGTDVNLIEVGGSPIALGQAAMAASLPVVIASDQSPVPVTGSISATNPSVGPTGDPIPAEATLIGVSNADGDLAGLASVAVDMNSTTPPVVPVNGWPVFVPGAGGPVVAGTTTTPFRVAGNGTAGTANAGVVTVQGIASMTPVQVSQATAANLNATVVGTGTFVTQATATGNVAADSADSGNPVKVGTVAFSPDGTTPGTAVTEGDRSNAKSDLDGRLLTNEYHPTTKTVHLDGSSAYTDQALIADPGDGFQTVITNIIGSTGAATALNFFLEEGSTKIFGPIYLEAVAGRGFCSGPIYLPCTPSTAVTLTSSAAIAQSFQVQYFTQAV